MRGFVAQAAIPRFLAKTGQLNKDRDWTTGDKMIDLDGQASSYDIKTTTENRNIFKPLDGFRRSLFTMVEDK